MVCTTSLQTEEVGGHAAAQRYRHVRHRHIRAARGRRIRQRHGSGSCLTPVASVIVNGFGVIDSADRVATPVPVSVTGEPVTATLPVIVTVPFAAPVAVGENTTLIVQLPPAPSVAVQLPPERVNGAVTATVTPVRAAVPVLCSVSVRVELVVPVAHCRTPADRR